MRNKVSIDMILVCVVLFLNNAAIGQSRTNNQIRSIQHHRKAASAAVSDVIEVANIIVYCTNSPTIERRNAKNNTDVAEYSFIIPNTTLSLHAKRSAQVLNQSKQFGYRVRLSPGAQDSVVISIVCDPHIGMQYQLFESIKKEKGIVFSFYNNDLIKKLHKEQPVLTTAYNAKGACVVVDCGHGGKDTGASSMGLTEKEVCLTVGIELTKMLRKQGFEVFLTRRSDIFVPLEYRTSAANAAGAHLYISLHVNSAPNEEARGIETYYLDAAALKTELSSLSERDLLLVTSLRVKLAAISKSFADTVHKSLITQMQTYTPSLVDRRVKKDVSHVLLGTAMPAILIEMGFLSNPSEEKLLKDHTYQCKLAHAICNGITQFAYTRLV
jgi:N-acetylmuramoyl-L-alanine amidase